MRAAAAACLVLLVALACGATAAADQLADIKAHGKLVCGTLGTSEPFSFQDPATRELVGYDVDMCRRIAASLGVALELKGISVEARIPELMLGRVDIIAANLGYTKERAEQIDFSSTYFVSAQKILVRHDSGIADWAELAGKKVSATKGSTSEQGVHRLIPDAVVQTFQDGPSAFLAVAQGKVQAFCASELILVKLRRTADAGNPVDVIAKPLFVEPWGLGLRKGEAAFRQQVNATLAAMEASGEAASLYAHWFGATTIYNLRREFTIAPISE